MKLRHRVHIKVARPDGSGETVLRGGSGSIRSRVLDRLLGGRTGILLLTPGTTVEEVEVREVGDENDDG